jgi:predicted nucleic acid-binding protein
MGRWNRKRITKPQIAEFLSVLRQAEIRVINPGMASSFDELPEQMWKHGLTSYDAAYLALAKKLQIPLATFDKNIRKAAMAEGVELVEVEG